MSVWVESKPKVGILPREKTVRRYDGFTRPGDLNIWLADINSLIFGDEYELVVEQTHAIKKGWAEHPASMATVAPIVHAKAGKARRRKRT